MKRSVKVLGIFSLSLLLLVVPSHSFAERNLEDTNTMSVRTKEIERYRVVFTGVDIAPRYYTYNVAGWSGTLERVDWVSTGSQILGYYSGTVTCTGHCVSKSDDK